MVLVEKIWDDMSAGPRPHRGIGNLRKVSTKPLTARDVEGARESSCSKLQGSMSLPTAPVTPLTPVTPTGLVSVLNGDAWRNAFNPGVKSASKSTAGDMQFDKRQLNSLTVYDWPCSTQTWSTHHCR